jgi:dynein heavy chain
VTGNSCLSAGMIAYAGPFTSEYRNKLEHGWNEDLNELGIPIS